MELPRFCGGREQQPGWHEQELALASSSLANGGPTRAASGGQAAFRSVMCRFASSTQTGQDQGEVVATLDLSELVFVPAGQPPHKPGQTITAAYHRLRMLQLAMASHPSFTISQVDLQRPGPSYTVETLRLLHQQWDAQTAFYFIPGGDSLEEFLSWRDPAGILEQLTYLVAVQRPDYEEAPAYRASLGASQVEFMSAGTSPYCDLLEQPWSTLRAQQRAYRFGVINVLERALLRVIPTVGAGGAQQLTKM